MGLEVLEDLEAQGHAASAFIAESFLGCGGQIIPPDGFLAQAYEVVHATGAVCIADEVQVGFGRAGSHTWAFESQGAVPDIVTLGKPAASLLLGRDVAITRLRGTWQEYRGIPMMPTLHPAYVLRQYTPENRRAVWEDLKAALARSQEA